jgi:hypothetical protein
MEKLKNVSQNCNCTKDCLNCKCKNNIKAVEEFSAVDRNGNKLEVVVGAERITTESKLAPNRKKSEYGIFTPTETENSSENNNIIDTEYTVESPVK